MAGKQTEPAEMHRYALAAACAEMYPDALRHFRRDKVLAAFDLSLTDNERDGIYADMESNGGRLGIEASAKLSAFLNATAIRHVALDEYSALDSMRGGFPTTNFGAVMELCAGEVSGTDLVSPAQHASELRSGAHLGKENDMDAKAIKELKPPKGGVYDKTGNMLSGYGWVAALLVVAAVAGAGYAGKQYLDARKEKDGDADGGES